MKEITQENLVYDILQTFPLEYDRDLECTIIVLDNGIVQHDWNDDGDIIYKRLILNEL